MKSFKRLSKLTTKNMNLIIGIIILFIFSFFFIKFFNSVDSSFIFFLNFYKKYQYFVSSNYLFSVLVFIITSILLVAFIGAFIPVLLLSVITFQYYGILYVSIAILIGSVVSYSLAKIFDFEILKSIKKKLEIKEHSFYLYLAIRLAPGLPFLFKNFSGVLFNFDLKKFFLACLITDVPQIALFSYFLNNVIVSVEDLLNNKNLGYLLNNMLLPTFLLFLFVISIYILKKKNT
tara:strand:+ start:536 stop:1234 length:699 start_codon:yes stop_codon:yes gene_type:complete